MLIARFRADFNLLKRLVHTTMDNMIGATGKEPLPIPLTPGQQPRHDSSGAELWNPHWSEPCGSAYNSRYIKTAVGLMQSNEKVSNKVITRDRMIYLPR